MDSASGTEGYSVIEESYKLLQSAALEHPLTAMLLSPDNKRYARHIQFTGTAAPAMPVVWRFAESVAVLKALEGIMINALLDAKYNLEPQDIIINIDHAQLFIASCLLTEISQTGQDEVKTEGFSTTSVFPICDIFRNSATPYRTCAGNLYKTKDGRYYHLHSDLNPDVIQDALGLPHDVEGDYDQVYQVYQDKTLRFTSDELDELANHRLKRSGTVAWSTEEYKDSKHGKANSSTGLWSITAYPNSTQEPGWWPSVPQTSPARPLAGLKVVDFSRIIAAPTLTRGLAELGASVMRITASHLPDMGFLHPDMGWGKWNCALDLRVEADRERAKDLIREADVVVYGYRPSVLDKYGLGERDVRALCADRDRGVIIARLDCYG